MAFLLDFSFARTWGAAIRSRPSRKRQTPRRPGRSQERPQNAFETRQASLCAL